MSWWWLMKFQQKDTNMVHWGIPHHLSICSISCVHQNLQKCHTRWCRMDKPEMSYKKVSRWITTKPSWLKRGQLHIQWWLFHDRQHWHKRWSDMIDNTHYEIVEVRQWDHCVLARKKIWKWWRRIINQEEKPMAEEPIKHLLAVSNSTSRIF